MLEIREYLVVWSDHELTPAGPIPTAADPDGCYPYESCVETSTRPVLKEFVCVEIENDLLRTVICPALGGRVHWARSAAKGTSKSNNTAPIPWA
ncbi:MAG: DUF5107 domain-containing protein [Verrucomicrobiota bacterium]|nr:DUF5107 domain-containing protein [Verrucomicrobiota bacterium]